MNIFTVLLTQPLANGLIVFYNILGSNMGLAIIFFSLFLRFLLNPLTKPYMDSMKRMKEIAPQIEKLKKRHKGDKLKFSQAQADLYKEKGINPGAGCLPYLLQIVVLIAFFRMFNLTLTTEAGPTTAFNELLYSPLKIAQDVAINTRFLYLDITQPDVIVSSLIPFTIPGPLLFLAALTQLVSAKIMQPYENVQEALAKKTPESSDDFQVAMQKSMIVTFPLMTLFIGLKFPSGLALYWFIFSFYQAYQQYKTQGWGGMTPWLNRLGLLKSENSKK